VTYYERFVKVGGQVNCGGHLGVFVALEKHINRCPPGWIFVPLETATVDTVKEAIVAAKRGRKDWPTNARIK